MNRQLTFSDHGNSHSALLVSIPYGALADRIGRKKVLILALTGCLLCDTWVAIVCVF